MLPTTVLTLGVTMLIGNVAAAPAEKTGVTLHYIPHTL